MLFALPNMAHKVWIAELLIHIILYVGAAELGFGVALSLSFHCPMEGFRYLLARTSPLTIAPLIVSGVRIDLITVPHGSILRKFRIIFGISSFRLLLSLFRRRIDRTIPVPFIVIRMFTFLPFLRVR